MPSLSIALLSYPSAVLRGLKGCRTPAWPALGKLIHFSRLLSMSGAPIRRRTPSDQVYRDNRCSAAWPGVVETGVIPYRLETARVHKLVTIEVLHPSEDCPLLIGLNLL